MSTSFLLSFFTILCLSSTLTFGQTQRPNPNLRFCGKPKNEGYIPHKICNTNFRDLLCVDFATGAPDPQFCSTGMCAIEAGEDGIAAIDSRIYGELILITYLFKPEQQAAEVVTKIREAFTAWETWKECIAKLYVITLKAKNVKQSFGLKSPEIRTVKEKLENMTELLTTIKVALKKAEVIGIKGKYFDVLVSQALKILSVEEGRLEQLSEYFTALTDDIEMCPQ